jgi:hypothetical protein
MVHGGGYKADRYALEALWREALAAGFDRDLAADGGRRLLDGTRLVLAYYGDLVNSVLARGGNVPDVALDLEDRRRDLRRLAELTSSKKFRRIHYEAVPGKSAVAELVADVAAPVLNALRLTDPVLARRLPALAAYLSRNAELRTACEARVMEVLAPALERGDNVLLVSHAMGSVVSYDALWRLSHEPEHTASATRVRTWLTLGSPLASEYVKKRLRGSREPDARRHPDKVINWYNVAAEDDYHCHDKTVCNDFAALLKHQRLSQIRDYRIYNLAIRYGRSNPHNAVGYLIHPRITRLVADWLKDGPG